MGPTLPVSIEFSTQTEILATPEIVAHQLQEKLSNLRSLAEQHTHDRDHLGSQRAGYLAEVRRVREPKIANK